MGPESILLSVERGGSQGIYRFVCPECLGSVEKRADRKIVALLVSAGVDVADPPALQTEIDYLPEESPANPLEDEPLRESDAPPFTIDDVIRFHFLLRDDQFLRQLTQGS